jgi:hypothetical protein
MSDDIKCIDYIPINDMTYLSSDYSEIEKLDVKNNDMIDYVVLLLNNFKCNVNIDGLITYVITYVIANDDTDEYVKYTHLLQKIDFIKKNINYEHDFCYCWDNTFCACESTFDILDNNKDNKICHLDICSLFNKLTHDDIIIDKTIILFVITCLENDICVDRNMFIDGLKKIDDFYK